MLSGKPMNNQQELRKKQLLKRRRQRISALLVLAAVLLFSAGAFAVEKGRSENSTPIKTSTDALDSPVSVQTAATQTEPAESAQPAAVIQTQTAAPLKTNKLAGKVICIDPGHASNPDLGTEPIGPGSSQMKVKDPGGTAGMVTGIGERVVTLAIAEDLKPLLEAEGATVVMTREGEIFHGGNIERAQIANNAHADLFLRIHADGSTNHSETGASTLYPADIPGWTNGIYAQSKKAAAAVQSSMVNNLGVKDDGIVKRSDLTGFNWSKVPAILVECGFMTDPAEEQKLISSDYQQQIAKALLLGIESYFSTS
ncbi:MAG: N-acetylmuramoyl-L-alanine amidase [Actinomycetota bacterium]|nr:N-acetylmuramoyl-L-alanine amidase [Actinomycetota bacterium]MCL6093820.1 N-acetylmuramoyl-L-alanine amidase [Actinomycetota bacterium]MDA8167598.1 N-acetylmuramoyl-L-alanine amidase [Actinomycetota bacterium]